MRPVGDHAALLELPSNAAVHAAAGLARDRFADELVEVVPGHRTLLLVWDEGLEDAAALKAELAGLVVVPEEQAPAARVTIAVRYDGADLEGVAAKLGVSSEAVVELHATAEYTVAFTGFSPGFPYLLAEKAAPLLEMLLALPRLETPRTEVPAGSVAVAAGYCGIYPRSSPGGWNLIGRTDIVLFDVEREPPALLEPGMRVRFAPGSG